MEFTREEKIIVLKNSISIKQRAIEISKELLNTTGYKHNDIIADLKKFNLEIQAYELLLHKLEKGEAK